MSLKEKLYVVVDLVRSQQDFGQDKDFDLGEFMIIVVFTIVVIIKFFN